jgi:hypothetical protein
MWQLGRIGIAFLVGVFPALIAMFAFVEAADVLGAKGFFEAHEGPVGVNARGDHPDDASLLSAAIGFGVWALYAVALAALTVLLFQIDASPSLADDLADKSTLACTEERPDFCAEGWDQTAETTRWGVLAFAVAAAITFVVHLLLRLSGRAVAWMDEKRF